MRHTASALALLCVLGFCSDAIGQSRVWRDVYGNASTGTFQRFRKDAKGDPGNDRVVIRANGKIVGLKFWELMPDSQQFVKDQLIGQSEGSHLEITDIPHDWTSRAGVKGTGQFLKVEDDGKIAVVIASEKKLFEFEEFCNADQDYIRSVLARSGKEKSSPRQARRSRFARRHVSEYNSRHAVHTTRVSDETKYSGRSFAARFSFICSRVWISEFNPRFNRATIVLHRRRWIIHDIRSTKHQCSV